MGDTKESTDKELTESGSKIMAKLDQAEAHYTPVSVTPGKACSSCMWWRWDSCHIVASDPEAIVPNGYCDEHRVATPLAPSNVAPLPVVIVDVVTEDEASQEMALPTTRRGLVDIITDTVNKVLHPAPAEEPAFSVFKSTSGKKYWLSRHTGKFKDREEEIIANKAHDEYVERVQKGLVPMPELWTWHTKGTRQGEAFFVWKSGGFTLALGTFDDTPVAEHAFKFYEKNRGKIKLSHMFNYPTSAKQNGVYYAYNTVEITTLPDGAEAFPYTSFEEILPMTLTEQQREFIKGVGGDEMLKRAEAADAKAVTDTKTLESIGVQSKGLDNFEGSTIPPVQQIEALKVIQADFATQLKAVEGLPGVVEGLRSTIKTLGEQVAEGQQRESELLKKINDQEKKLLEYTALTPPSSQSGDTLLNEREKTLLGSLEAAAKVADSPSLVEIVAGNKPAVTASS